MNDVLLLSALGLMLLVAALRVVAGRTAMPAPILMLLTGAAVSLVPGVPVLHLEPELVLMLLLPPLLYSSAVAMSWRGFRQNLRPILLMAVGCVVFTASAVAAVGHYALGLAWPVGFVLGAVVSPPDPVAPIAIARRLGLPRRIMTVLEGEGLVNDATALVLFNFALAAVVTGNISVPAAALQFIAIIAGELLFGVTIGWAMLRLRHMANDPRAEIMLSLATPFITLWPPHLLGGSGVLACVAAGLYVSWTGPGLIRPATRLQAFFVWDLVSWSIEALIFLLIGLEAHTVFLQSQPGQLGTYLLAAALISGTVILVRFVWVFPAAYLPRILWPPLARREPAPDWRLPMMVGFTGLRGVVSVAAVLSIPVSIGNSGFPDRNLILAVTFGVIVVTLVGQGGLLPLVIRRLGLDRDGRAEAERDKKDERAVRRGAVQAALGELDRIEADGAQPEVVAALRKEEQHRLAYYEKSEVDPSPRAPGGAPVIKTRLLEAERHSVAKAYAEGRLSDDARRRLERELDLEATRASYASDSLSAPGTP
jgi:Na+/H+ antiporter